MKAIDFLKKYVFGRLNQYGLTNKLNSLWIQWMIEAGLSKIYHITPENKFKWHTWELKTEAFPFTWCNIRLQTKFPIKQIKGFYSWDLPIILEFNDTCDTCWCSEVESWVCTECGTTCSCDIYANTWSSDKKLELQEKSAWAQMIDNEYQVIAGRNNGWYWWQIIYLKLKSDLSTKNIWVEYYAGYNPINCLDDEILLPLPLYPVLADYIISDALDIYGQSREWVAANIYSKARDALFAFNETDSRTTDIKKVDTRANEKQQKSGSIQTDVKANTMRVWYDKVG